MAFRIVGLSLNERLMIHLDGSFRLSLLSRSFAFTVVIRVAVCINNAINVFITWFVQCCEWLFVCFLERPGSWFLGSSVFGIFRCEISCVLKR